MTKYNVAVLGATGVVGQRILSILEARKFPVKHLKPLASARSAGGTITFNGRPYLIEAATPESFETIDLVLASAGGSISQALVPAAIKHGAVVVDNTSFYRMHPDVPLVVAGVNDDDLKTHQGIVANPNCSTAQLMPVLKALHNLAGLQRAVISTYQSASGGGKAAMDELQQTIQTVVESGFTQPAANRVFSKPLAFNLIAQIDQFLPNGYTKEEMKVIDETRKILHLPHLNITATAVRVPVLISHSESVTLDFERLITPEEAIACLKQVPDVEVREQPENFPTPLEAEGIDPVLVGRIRQDTSNPERGLNMWVVADNLRIGAALNAVRIAEKLDAMGLIRSSSPV